MKLKTGPLHPPADQLVRCQNVEDQRSNLNSTNESSLSTETHVHQIYY